MKGIRIYKTAIAITFVLAFLAQALLHASISHAFAQNTDKTWTKEIHKAFHPVVLVKHLKVKPLKYQLTRKYEPGRALEKQFLLHFSQISHQQNGRCIRFDTGASLLQFICVLLI